MVRLGAARFGLSVTLVVLGGQAAAAQAPAERGIAPTDLTAAALVADPPAVGSGDGNRVFEPGETIVLAPSWHNVLTVPAGVMGVLSAFTGPGTPGAYTITDADAAYAFPAGATRSCLDGGVNCYGLSVAAGPRPSVHWDATAFETLSNASLKSWVIHLGDSFSDVPRGNPFYRFVETLLHNKVTGGCTATAYCPGNVTTREQMAVFALAAKEGSYFAPAGCIEGDTVFGDVPASSPFCSWVQELARRGVVSGCGGGNYCGTAAVSREQMAVFALLTREGTGYVPPACVAGSEAFSDVPASSPFCAWIEELARRAVVGGCGGGRYCPTDPVTREQMSVFLSLTFGLSLYGPQPNAYVVNSTSDLDDGACTPIHCSWREAVAAANATPNGAARDEIRFALPGTGPFTIRPSVASFTEAVVVDGYSQPGSSPNTAPAPQGLDSVLLVELDLSLAGGVSVAFDSLVRGLVLNGGGAGVVMTGQRNAVQGCFIGTDPAGTIARPNTDGVLVEYPFARLNRIGGLAPATRNLISGNINVGVHLPARENVVQGNLIGTNRTGSSALGNGRVGVYLDGGNHLATANSNVIGGLEAGAGNVIGGSGIAGVQLSSTCCASLGTASNNRIQSNLIGRSASGTPIPNAVGVFLNGFSAGGPVMNNNLIGGDSVAPAGNLIADNTGYGVSTLGGSGTRVEGNAIRSNGDAGVRFINEGSTTNPETVRGNSIFDNAGPGITSNVPAELPVLASAQAVVGATIVSGVVPSSSAVTVDFYASPTADPTGFGEGLVYLGFVSASPNVTFSATLPAVPVGWMISATSTYLGSRTSSFALSIPVAP